jgi:polysaccharide chain length determinant protein (PEP-CTERM system associated)
LPEQDLSLDETLDKVFHFIVRRRWWVLLPATVIALGAGAASLLLPNRYQSEATILVEHQQVPERYVAANTTSDITELLMGMTDAILSRTQLLEIINEFGLYRDEQKRMDPGQLVHLMRGNIKIEPLKSDTDTKDLYAFKVAFTGADARTAQAVTNKLTTLFIQENLKSREDQSTETTNFLSDELDVAAAELKQQEARVRDFKMHSLGELPEQQQGNLAILAGLHTELQNTMAILGRAREQQVYLQSLLSQYENLAATGGIPGGAGTSPHETLQETLTRLQNEKADLLARYTPQHPDVVKMNQQIKETEARLAAAAQAPDSTHPGSSQSGTKAASPTGTDSATAQVKSQLEANRIEIANATEDERRLQERIADYQRRLNLTPVREEQLADLLRGYDQSKQYYDDLLRKKTQSELATSLERRQEGQRFRIIDPPSLPMKPASPDHLKMSLTGLMAGIAAGLALAFLTETKDHSLRDEQELRHAFTFPMLIAIPTLLTKVEQQKRRQVKALEWVVGAVMCLLVCATEFYVYRRG